MGGLDTSLKLNVEPYGPGLRCAHLASISCYRAIRIGSGAVRLRRLTVS